jgi:hypothetical protein
MAHLPEVFRVAVALFPGFTVLDVYGPVQAVVSDRLPTLMVVSTASMKCDIWPNTPGVIVVKACRAMPSIVLQKLLTMILC